MVKNSKQMIRQAVIIAAGKGGRMKDGTSDKKIKSTPKPLLEVKGEPMIEGKIKKLVKNGVEVCVVINSDFEDMFRKKLGKYKIEYRYQPEPLGTANAVYCAKDFVEDELFLVMMGDDIADYDVLDMLKTTEPVIFGFEVDDVSSYGALVINKKGEVEGIIEKQKSGRGFVNTGVYIMPKLFFDYYKDIGLNIKGERGLEDAPKILSKHGIRFKLKKIDNWFGINTPKELSEANR